MHQQATQIRDLLIILRRRLWLIVSFIAVSLSAAGILCVVLPKSYRSTTLIMVESQKIPDNYVKGVLSGTVQDRLATMQQLILSRTLLTSVIESYNLYPAQRVAAGGIDNVVEAMRKKIRISTSREQAFSISFGHEDRFIAQQVTAALATRFIEENLKIREQLVEGASEFLMTELEKAKAELEAKEKAISEFKRLFMGELPQQLEANLRSLDRLQIQLSSYSEALASRTDRLNLLEKSIKEYESNRAQGGEFVSANGKKTVSASTPRSRLRELKERLATLRGTYKETYPDIVYLQEEIKRLEAQPIEIEEAPADVPEAGGTKRVVDPYLRELVKQRNELKAEIDTIKERQVRLNQEIKMYEGRVERTPAQEQRLMILVRDYDNMQKNYQSLLEKRLNARISESLERKQKGEQFRVIDPANLPEQPETPNVMFIMLAGLAVGCGAGTGVAVLLEGERVSFSTAEEAESLLGIPILASIPSYSTAYGGTSKKLLSLGGSVRQEQNPASTMTTQSRPERVSNGNGKVRQELTTERHGSPDLNLVVKWRPRSVVAEQYRVAGTRLSMMGLERKSTVVVVTSAVKGEGKSATSLNLAYVLAQDLNKNSLLIDCDLGRSRISAYAGIPHEPGLSDILNEKRELDACLRRMDEVPMWILPAGSRTERPLELFKIKKVGTLIPELRSRFEFIILDAPPILPLADMNVLAGIADVLVLVVRGGETSREVVQRAMKTLKPSIQTGLILTGLKTDTIPYYMQQPYYAEPERKKSII